MEGRFDHEHNEDSSLTPPSENTADSSISGDEAAEEAYAPSPKKSRRGANKRVVTVPIGDGDGCRSKSEVYPPPDSWSWRKYGQKPIKGSPYPRGYYRCSSSKGCPARKQVERSRLDPTTLLITYSCNHNHPLPTTTKNHHHHHHVAAAKSAITSSSSDTTSSPQEESAGAISHQPDIESCPADNGFVELAGEFGWLCNVGPTIMDGMTLVGTTWGAERPTWSSPSLLEKRTSSYSAISGTCRSPPWSSGGIGWKHRALPAPDEVYNRRAPDFKRE